jgi:acetyltransferase EpsM
MEFVIIGNGGHSKVISDMVRSNKENEIVGYLDDKFETIKLVDNHFYGPISSAQNLTECFSDLKFVIAIGNNSVRKKIVGKLDFPDEYYATVIHKSAVISPGAEIGLGTVVMPNAVINADAKIGRHAIVNTGSVVEHDCKIGDFAHICPHAVLTGGVQIEEGVSVGAGAAIIPNITVKEWAVIGAGATVISNISSGWTAVGTPARTKNQVEVK